MDIGLTDCPVDVCKTALTLPGDEQSTESVEEELQDQSPVRARQQNSLMGQFHIRMKVSGAEVKGEDEGEVGDRGKGGQKQ